VKKSLMRVAHKKITEAIMSTFTRISRQLTHLASRALISVLTVAGLSSLALAQANYPDRPIRVVVPYTPGGGSDTNARMLAQPMSAFLGQPIVIENKPGASGVVGAMAVLQSPADGYTFEELGYLGFQVVEWNGFFVAKGTPVHIIDRLAKAIHESSKDPAIKSRMESMGIEPVGNTPEQFTTFLQGEIKQWRALVQSNNIRAD
jgi:tripartite-type tricarboxylate transporter receptor subunit TctC